MATVYDDDLYLDAHEPVGEPPEEPCFHGCGVYGSGPDLLRHEREEHTRCPHCGMEPGEEPYPVTHKIGCVRLSADPDSSPVTSPVTSPPSSPGSS